MHKLLPVFCLIIFLVSCKQKSASANNIIARDTTITPQNAITDFKLDSLTLDSFIKKEINDKEEASKVLSFYNSRNYQYAWFNENGLTEQAEGFWNQHENNPATKSDSSGLSKWLHQKMDVLLNEDTVFNQVDSLSFIEMGITLHFFNYVRTALNNKVSPEEMQWHIPQRKLHEREILDSFLLSKENRVHIFNQNYYRLQNKLANFLSIQKKGGWEKIDWEKQKIKIGNSNELVTAIKKRLAVSGEWVSSDTSVLFTDSLQSVIKKLQSSLGLSASGVIDAPFVSKLNIPVEDRIKQMIVNLQRMKWMPELPQSFLIANIPEFKLHVIENKKEVFNMRIVVGKAANRTVIFSDELKYVVFSPYWNVPRSIVRNEILPAMSRNKNYIRRNNMEITGYSNGLPVVRQKPGRGNALGDVKFIFPNRYNIYFHDTPAKSLFERQQRTFSHGCIRLQKPFELARYLLRDESEWTDKAIREAMNSHREKWVDLKEPLPVFIVYFTAWVDNDGMLNFRDDVYGHDKQIESHLFS